MALVLALLFLISHWYWLPFSAVAAIDGYGDNRGSLGGGKDLHSHDQYYSPMEAMPIVAQDSLSSSECHPPFDPSCPQCMIGYGSLINEESKRETTAATSLNIPVEVQGYRRSWNARGFPMGRSTTFMGVLPGPGSLNGVLYHLLDPAADLSLSDERERFYCRRKLDSAAVTLLIHDSEDRNGTLCVSQGQVWIYVTRPASLAPPSPRFPIVQSYVDVVLTGALQLEQLYGLPGFAARLLDTTAWWSPYWVNDRVFPRRPFVFVPEAIRIDRLLSQHPVTGQLYPCIPIE